MKARTDLTGRFCACGRPAVKVDSNTYVCQRCMEIEDWMYRAKPDSQSAYITRTRPVWQQVIEPFRCHLPV